MRAARAGAACRLEWQRLHATLSGLGAKVELVPPQAGLPDLVFTANAAVVLDGKALLARFRHPERQREEPHFETAFSRLKERGLVTAIEKLPEGIVLEGAGDCVWDETRGLFWMGYGPRSDAAAPDNVRARIGSRRRGARACRQPFLPHGHGALPALPQ